MADPDFELRGGPGFFSSALPAFLYLGWPKVGGGAAAAGGVGGGSSLRSPTAYSKKLQSTSF